MSHPRQDEDRRLGQNDESEASKTPGSMRRSSPSEENATEVQNQPSRQPHRVDERRNSDGEGEDHA